ncbi:MAG TPA: ATP-binding protein [Aggregatilineaceae bacterium]|nr:ATP-binding protein [Aggregatilineaceae bacterium]
MNSSRGLQARLSETLRLTLLYRLASELNAELRSTEVLRRVLNATAEALGTPHASIVAVKNKEQVNVYALGGGEVDPTPVIQCVLANGLAGFVMHNYRTVVINDIENNPLWLHMPNEPLSPQQGSALCVPLIHAGDVVGVMTLAHPASNYFTSDAVNLTSTISEMGASALASAMLLEASRQAEQRYASLFDDVIVPIIITDLQGNIHAVNRRTSEFLGYGRDELLHLSIMAVHRMGTGPIGADRFDNLKLGLEVRFQSVVWCKDGTSRNVQVYAKRISMGADSDLIQWIEYDLTSQLALEQLRQDLSAMVYHDMRGPLGNVYTSLQALNKLIDHENSNVKSLLSVAIRSEEQVRRMIDSLLDVQRLEEGSRLLSRTNSVINTVITSAVEQVQPMLEDKNMHIRLALADDLPVLYLDQDMIERVILNLLDNAIKYSSDNDTIIVSSASGGTEVYIRIKDTGPGIPPDAQNMVFDKFWRVKQRNVPNGAGLGLAFCKLAVEAHGGRIWVRSEGSSGSTFTFALPVEAPATQELPLLGKVQF